MTVLKVEKVKGNKLNISYPANHPKKKDIERWLTYLSPGYTEFLIQTGHDPHCNSCRDYCCENVGMEDDACPAFKYGDKW